MMAQAGAVRAHARVTEDGYNGSSVRARSGLSEAETEVQARTRVHRATVGQRNWRLSLAGHKLWQWQSVVTETGKLREGSAAVAGT